VGFYKVNKIGKLNNFPVFHLPKAQRKSYSEQEEYKSTVF